MARVWENKFVIIKTKYVQALNTDIIVLQRIATADNSDAKSGLYYIEAKFCEIDPNNGNLSEYIKKHVDDLEPIFEYEQTNATENPLFPWDAKGTPLTLAVSYVIKKSSKYYARLVALSKLKGNFTNCNEIDDIPQVYHIEMISPPGNYSRVFTLYGTANGLDGGAH